MQFDHGGALLLFNLSWVEGARTITTSINITEDHEPNRFQSTSLRRRRCVAASTREKTLEELRRAK
jgi:hypothetical protein